MKDKIANKIEVTFKPVTLEIPNDQIMIKLQDYKELRDAAEKGKYLSLNDVLELLSVSRP